MKIIEKTSLVLFSILILIISVLFSLLIFGWLDIKIFEDAIIGIMQNSVSSNIILGLNTVFILLAIKCIFFSSNTKGKNEYKNGILLENADGKLLITRETIENLVNNVVKGFDISTRIELNKDNTIEVYVNLSVRENAVIKELSTNLQTKIKNTIKKTSDLEVKGVNIKVKNVEPVKENVAQ